MPNPSPAPLLPVAADGEGFDAARSPSRADGRRAPRFDYNPPPLLFNTVEYAVFFGVVFAVSWLLAGLRSPLFRTLFLLAASYGFYAAWDVRYLPLIFGSSTVDFFLARAIAAEARPNRRRALLIVTVVLNLGFLGFFKYGNFAVENLQWISAHLTGRTMPSLADSVRIALPPVGISFFTFESMSYVIDVYRGELRPHRSYLRYLLFVSFFPHLVAGPIVRPRDLLPQLEARARLIPEEAGEGLFLIAIGLTKKIAISDQLALQLVDRVFERPTSFSALEVLCAVYGYAVQIYCDFSGYTDIAIGSALLLGVRFPKNFDSPYKAKDLADFWRRWHISLSTWLRDYLYIPLGGNREGEAKTYRNLMLTMLLGGLWHGASWTFVFWGFLHGAGLVVTRMVQRRKQRQALPAIGSPSAYRGAHDAPLPKPEQKSFSLGRVAGVLLTFHYVCLAWIFFRAPSFGHAVAMLRQIATRTTFHPNLPPVVLAILGIGLLSHFVPEGTFQRTRKAFTLLPAPAQGVVLFGVALLLHEVTSTAVVPFVYFQF